MSVAKSNFCNLTFKAHFMKQFTNECISNFMVIIITSLNIHNQSTFLCKPPNLKKRLGAYLGA